jgi:hypothetical protein
LEDFMEIEGASEGENLLLASSAWYPALERYFG